MNILLIGEYSSFALNLKEGLRACGANVVHIHEGDGWKGVDQTNDKQSISFNSCFKHRLKIGSYKIKGSWRLWGAKALWNLSKLINKYKGYFDVVWIINYQFIREEWELWYPRLSYSQLDKVLRFNGKIFLSACGMDLPYCIAATKLPKLYQGNLDNNVFRTPKLIGKFNKLIRCVEGVIPVMFEYAYSYKNYNFASPVRICETIPLPINTESFSASNRIDGKIKILYGKNRIAKGTPFVLAALERIQNEYFHLADVQIVEHVPFGKYIDLVKHTNILIDQCQSYSYGMNAIIGMAAGKVVLSGNELECQREFKQEIPIVNIRPNEDFIFNQLEYLITHPEIVENLSSKSALFARNFHDSKLVANRYLTLFGNE